MQLASRCLLTCHHLYSAASQLVGCYNLILRGFPQLQWIAERNSRMAVTSASSGTRCIHDDTQKQQQHLNDNYDHDLDELKLAAAEVLALSHHSSTAKHRQEEVHGHQRQQRDHTQDIHAGYAAYTTMTADGNGNGNGSTSELQPSSPSSTKQATAAGNTGNSNGKRRIKASSTSEAAGMDSSDNPKAKRKKVSKACIFCKR